MTDDGVQFPIEKPQELAAKTPVCVIESNL